MTFRTLLVGVIIFGLVSGWLGPLVLPLLVTFLPDKDIMSSAAPIKCIGVKSSFDSSDKPPPSCFGVLAVDVDPANAIFQDPGLNSDDPEEQARALEDLTSKIRREREDRE